MGSNWIFLFSWNNRENLRKFHHIPCFTIAWDLCITVFRETNMKHIILLTTSMFIFTSNGLITSFMSSFFPRNSIKNIIYHSWVYKFFILKVFHNKIRRKVMCSKTAKKTSIIDKVRRLCHGVIISCLWIHD